MPILKRLVAAVEYDKDGETKTRWQECGVIMENNGKEVTKIDALPVGPGWNGFLQHFEPREKEFADNMAKLKKEVAVSDDVAAEDATEIPEDDIPF